MTARGVSIVVADRHPVFLSGLVTILRAQSDFNVLASCSDSTTCIQAIQGLAPALALIDIGLDGLHVLAAIKGAQAPTRVVFLSGSCARSEVARAIAAGAYGMISRQQSPDALMRELRKVSVGVRLWPPVVLKTERDRVLPDRREDQVTTLTDREREIMHLVCAGLSNKEVGRQLNLSDGTIKVHLHHIYKKLAVRNRTALVALASASDEEEVKKATSSDGAGCL